MFIDTVTARAGIRVNGDDFERTPDQETWSERLDGSRFDIPRRVFLLYTAAANNLRADMILFFTPFIVPRACRCTTG